MSTTVGFEQTAVRPKTITRFTEALQPELDASCPWSGSRAVVVDGPNVREIYLSVMPRFNTDGTTQVSEGLLAQITDTFESLAELLERCDASLDDLVTVDMFVDNGNGHHKMLTECIDAFLPEESPREVFMVPPAHPNIRFILQAYVVRPHRNTTFQRRSVPVDPDLNIWGVELRYGGFRQYYVAGIPGVGASDNSLKAHCDIMFERANKALVQEGFTIHDVPRTHLYYDGPYQDLRDSRHEYFTVENVSPEELPASTGVPARFEGDKVVMKLHAVQATGDVPLVSRRVDPKTQSQAYEYGSLFARARWIETDVAKLEVSGTASMGRDGRVIYQGRPKLQALKTRENVMDLVTNSGLKMDDLVRHIVYVCRPRHLNPWCDDMRAQCGKRGLPGIVTAVEAGVCWDKLTIEEEATAFSLRLPSNSA